VKESPDLSWRDAITHDATNGQKLFQDPHQAARMINLTLNTATRLHLQLRPNTQTQRPTSIVILGRDQQDLPIECRILPSQILWLPGFFYAMTEQAFKTIGSVTVEGLDFAELTVYTAALPKDDFCALFADFVDPGTQLPTSRLSDWLDQYARTAFGLPEFLNTTTFPEAGQVNLFWHSLLLEELVDSGQNKTAYGLLKSLLSAQTKILNSEHALFSTFSAADAKPAGTRNSVGSLIPIEQLLEIAGVKILHARKVSIGGGNGFAQPITFRFRGLEVTRDGKNGRVRMPDGTEFHHFGSSTKTFQVD